MVNEYDNETFFPGLLERGSTLTAVEEARPAEDTLDQPGMADELRRPMMLLVRAEKGR